MNAKSALGNSTTRLGSIPIGVPLGLLVASILACVSSPALPTPGPFPAPGVLQMTFDYAHYTDVMWSPDGNWIAAKRCRVQNYEAACLLSENELTLLDPMSGRIEYIDARAALPDMEWMTPTLWTPDSESIMLSIAWKTSTQGHEGRPWLIAYNLRDGSFEDSQLGGTPIAWNEDQTRILMVSGVDGQRTSIGWLDPLTGEFVAEIIYGPGEAYGPYALSPDGKALLRVAGRTTTDCTLEILLLGVDQDFSPFIQRACQPGWSPDGTHLAYIQTDYPSSGQWLVIADADGSNPQHLFSGALPFPMSFPSWSPDGKKIAFTYGGAQNTNAIYIAEVPEELRR